MMPIGCELLEDRTELNGETNRSLLSEMKVLLVTVSSWWLFREQATLWPSIRDFEMVELLPFQLHVSFPCLYARTYPHLDSLLWRF